MSEKILQVRALSKTYRSGFWMKPVCALSSVTFEVSRGEVFGLVGPNGAGKTTLFKLLTGLLKPSSGSGYLLGKLLFADAGRGAIGYLPENPALYDFLTGRQFLELMGALFHCDSRWTRQRIPELLEQVGLARQQNLAIRKYSKGMGQRLALAQALLNDPPLLILDEPMSGLDPVGRKLVRDLIGDLRSRGRTTIFSSHVLSDAEALCDRVGLMHSGKLVEVGTVSTLLNDQRTSAEIVLAGDYFDLPPGFPAHLVDLESRGGRVRIVVADGRDDLVEAVLEHALRSKTKVLKLDRHRETLDEYFVKRTAQLKA